MVSIMGDGYGRKTVSKILCDSIQKTQNTFAMFYVLKGFLACLSLEEHKQESLR